MKESHFYLIEEGSVVVASRMPTHSHIVIQTLGPGNAVGWSGLFKPYTWHLNARADEPTRVLSFRAATFASNARETRNSAMNS